MNTLTKKSGYRLTQLVVCLTESSFLYSMNTKHEIRSTGTNTTSRMPNSKVHVLYLNEYLRYKEIRSTALTQ